MRRARKAATATSLAAFSTIGASPPSASASRARRSAGKRPESGGSKVSGARLARSSRAAGPSMRAGQPSAWRSARACRACRAGPAPSRRDRRPGEWTTDCGWTTISICSGGRPNRRCASISSRPLFIMVAESTEILAPMSQFGCATACSGVALGHLGQRPGAERPARGGQDQPVDRARRWPASNTWKIALCSESTGSSAPPGRVDGVASAAGRRRPAPPCWRAPPWRRAGRRPGSAPGRRQPTIAAITQSAGRAAASTTASGPAAASIAVPASASFSAPVALRDRRPPRGAPAAARACSASASTELPAASASTR